MRKDLERPGRRIIGGPVDILILMGALVNVLVIAFFLFLYFRP